MNIPKHFQLIVKSTAAPDAIVHTRTARFTLLSERMIRMEHHPDGTFEDRPSQVFWHREQPVPDFRLQQQDGELILTTDALRLHYREGGEFSPETLWVELLGTRKTWRFGMEQKENLLGTTRTLDMADGAVSLEPGLLSRRGWTLVDDSASLVFNPQGWLEARSPGGKDLYFWAYGTDYRLGMGAFYRVAGRPGLLPRWALGNWWSRYWAYTQDELISLMESFKEHQVPLSVCIVDMDWHLTETGNGCSGWTGYTWNPKYFPDPEAFIRQLHQMGLKTGLNLHPAEGIWPHEAKYPEMAQAMGIDPASGQPVRFEIDNPDFALAYFEHLHYPKEAQGVDFWWMDWQQGNPTRLAGLNLLWWINHLHSLDAGKEKRKRPFLFSRWGGLGNHRYPIGFSGDTFVTWEALAFQPYMTATAANVGYSWWSHDIGGHMGGTEDGELYTRWVQFGVFSPILRLHSTKNALHERRPWGFDANVEEAAQMAMTFRHRLIPYIYSMAWKDHREGLPLVRPLYHLEPERDEAYACPNAYAFGTELIVAPITTPIDPQTRFARQVLWLPGEGETWYGVLDHGAYRGGSWQALYHGLKEVPVFARPGAILPLADETRWGGVENPQGFEIHAFPGASNRFELYEDDGESQAYLEGAYAVTVIENGWEAAPGGSGAVQRIRIRPAQGDRSVLPPERSWRLDCHGIEAVEAPKAWVNGAPVACPSALQDSSPDLRIGPFELAVGEELLVEVKCRLHPRPTDRAAAVKRLVEHFPLATDIKSALLDSAGEIAADPAELADYAAALNPAQLRALLETVTGAGLDLSRAGGKNAPARVVAWNNQGRPEIGFLYAVDRHQMHFTGARFGSATGLAAGCRIYWPDQELGKARARWALSYGSILRVEEFYE